MERGTEKRMKANNGNNEFGTVRIANDVVAMIAGLAATEVKGVTAMGGNITNELISKVGAKKLTKSVRVDILEKLVSVDLAINLAYGFSIPDTCKAIQDRVKSAIETMTGLEVADVNIRIVGIDMATN